MPYQTDLSLGMRTSSLRTLPALDTTPAIVTLGQGRSGPRATNEYVDSPRPRTIFPLKSTPIGPPSVSIPSTPISAVSGTGQSPRVSLPCRVSQQRTTLNTGSVSGGGSTLNGSGGGGGGGSNGGSQISSVISSQPSKAPPPPPPPPSLKEEPGVGDGAVGVDGHSSIICNKCGKCKCAACTEPRELPSHWCCEKHEVSAEKALDCCTCFCCVKTLFYHCGAEEDNSCYDDPCACGGSKCCSRWTCMAASSLFLPCLWLYWPMRACLAAGTACYNNCRKKGCECSRKRPADKCPASSCSKNSQTRRLLIESDSSSA